MSRVLVGAGMVVVEEVEVPNKSRCQRKKFDVCGSWRSRYPIYSVQVTIYRFLSNSQSRNS
jgi:hypothetical protein